MIETGCLFIVCGAPGAGKTTYGRELARRKNAAFVDIDQATERLVRLALRESNHDPDDRDSSYFKETFRLPIYATLFDIAEEMLPWIDVVVVGPFTRELRNPHWPDELRSRFGAPIEVHYVFCEPEIRFGRLQRRGSERDRAKLASWESYLTYYGNEEPPAFPHVFIDTSQLRETIQSSDS